MFRNDWMDYLWTQSVPYGRYLEVSTLLPNRVFLGSNLAEFNAHEGDKGDDMILNAVSATILWGNSI
jgi:hypothetical protein